MTDGEVMRECMRELMPRVAANFKRSGLLGDAAAKEKRYAWLTSQARWHQRRILKRNSRWHISQAKWFWREAGRVFTFTEMVSRSYTKHRADMIAAVSTINPLLQRLTQQ